MKRITFFALTLALALICISSARSNAQEMMRDHVEDCVDNTSWSITANGAFSGTWVFHRDGSVEGIYPAGGVAWTGRWHQLGHNRYVYEFDYQGVHAVQFVQFTTSRGEGRADQLLGYSDREMRNLNREGRLIASAEAPHHEYDFEDCVDNTSWSITANGAFSGTWVFHRDGSVEGIYPAGGVAWTGRWRQLGHYRYVYEFDYQGVHAVQFVLFTTSRGEGRADQLLGYSDREMRNLNREGRLAR